MGFIIVVGEPSTNADTDDVVTQDIINRRKSSSIPIDSITISMASHRRVSNALEKLIVMHARLDVLLQLNA